MQEELYHLNFIKELLFFVILLWVSHQDWKQKSITQRSLWLTGILGIGVSLVWKRSLVQILLSSGIGLALLLLSKYTNGGIGEGDGWFFTVSGLYISWQDNLQLFLSGLLLCFGVCLIVFGRSVLQKQTQKITLPFLPFLLPAGIEMIRDYARLLQ